MIRLALDIGNSAIKASAGEMQFCSAYSADWGSDFISFLQNFDKDNIEIFYCSVNDKALEELMSSLLKFPAIKITDIGDILGKQKLIDFSGTEGMGNDRKLGLIGAIAISAPPFITIDCGTATTINCVDAGRKCLGGAILPGIFTQYKSLHDNTSALKNYNLQSSPAFAGANTADAIASGILRGMAGAVIYIAKGIIKERELKDCRVVLTGGAAEFISAALKAEFPDLTEVADLNLQAIRTLALL